MSSYSSRDFFSELLLDLLGRLGCFVHLASHRRWHRAGRLAKAYSPNNKRSCKSLHAHLGVALDLESGKFF